jgi:hypothetical protein
MGLDKKTYDRCVKERRFKMLIAQADFLGYIVPSAPGTAFTVLSNTVPFNAEAYKGERKPDGVFEVLFVHPDFPAVPLGGSIPLLKLTFGKVDGTPMPPETDTGDF